MTKQKQAGRRLVVGPISLKEAKVFIERHHRHHRPPVGHKFSIAVAVAETGEVCGVATVGRPVSRHLDDGAAWRATKALGYRKLITYTLPSEGGASLRGAGWTCIGEAGGGSWSCKSRPRVDMAPTQVKMRWEVS